MKALVYDDYCHDAMLTREASRPSSARTTEHDVRGSRWKTA